MKIKNYWISYLSGLLFLLCALAVFFIFPKQKQFAYSYSIGSPWLHDNLTAPSDFPIYKTKEQLTFEQDSLKQAFIPFYIEDTTASDNYNKLLNQELNLIDTQTLSVFFDSVQYDSHKIVTFKAIYKDFVNKLDMYVSEVYEKGVIKILDTVKNKSLYRFYLYDEGVSELSYGNEYILDEDFQDGLLNIYNESGIKSLDSLTGYKIRHIITDLEVPSNIVYGEKISEKILESSMNSISPYWGMVKSGQLIITKGSIVDEKTSIVLDSFKMQLESENSSSDRLMLSLGIAIIFILLFVIIYLYLYNYHQEIFKSLKSSLFLILQMLMFIGAIYFSFDKSSLSLNYIPFALLPLLIITFYNFQISLIIYISTLFIGGFFAPNGFDFVFIQTIAGMVAMYSVKNTQKRSQIFITMGLTLLTYVILATGFHLMKSGTFNKELLQELYPYGVSSFLILLYLPFVFIFEKSFGFVSDFTLMELSNTNNPALRLLSEKSPGTFQHSLQVANLVESVVIELGGNSMLARTGALYHDIGKSVHPEYFIENQSGSNIHDKFDYEESAQKIISHVELGLELAKKYKLPSQIADFITMHHGTSVTKYFYNSWINANPDNIPIVSNFMYPGPKPKSIETAVMMMADAIEAASRTLSEYTPETIEKTVSKIIDAQLNDNQFSEVDITLKQISIAKKAFNSKIQNIYHARIVYPEIIKKK